MTTKLVKVISSNLQQLNEILPDIPVSSLRKFFLRIYVTLLQNRLRTKTIGRLLRDSHK